MWFNFDKNWDRVVDCTFPDRMRYKLRSSIPPRLSEPRGSNSEYPTSSDPATGLFYPSYFSLFQTFPQYYSSYFPSSGFFPLTPSTFFALPLLASFSLPLPPSFHSPVSLFFFLSRSLSLPFLHRRPYPFYFPFPSPFQPPFFLFPSTFSYILLSPSFFLSCLCSFSFLLFASLKPFKLKVY